MEWITIKNPRKPNHDLGYLKCDYCGCQSGAYLLMECFTQSPMICKGCLLDGVKAIDKEILSEFSI